MFTTAQKQYTVEDYKKLAEGDPHQLINGELIALGEPASTYGHQGITAEIFTQIWNFLKKNPIGEVRFAPVDVYFDENNILQPDIIYVSNENKDIIKEDGLHGAPDMIIEVLSPSTAYYDTKIKKRIYEKYGVKEYWIIDPDDNEVIGYTPLLSGGAGGGQNVDEKFWEFYRDYEKFTSKVLNTEIFIKL